MRSYKQAVATRRAANDPLLRAITGESESAVERKLKEQQKFIDEKYSKLGGKPALERIKKYGCNEDEEPIAWTPSYEELVEAIADFRIAHTLLTGCAQVGKTLAHTLIEVDTIVAGRCQTAWFYADAGAVDLNVPDQFRPVVEKYVEIFSVDTGRKFDRSRDRSINSRYEIESVGGIFSFANTSAVKPSRKGKAAAGGKGVSFPADMVFYEEKSQWMTNVDYSARMNASCLPTHPTRELGTPGSGQGIEASMHDCDYYFYPHYTCPHCGVTAPLSPKGCLLKKSVVKDVLGREKEVYLSASGRPLGWWHRDDENAVQSAYFGCSNCSKEIPEEARINARFCCTQTGISLREFLDSLPDGIPDKRYKVGIHLSPLTRKAGCNLAASLINDGINGGNADDWQQQKLGFASETTINSLTLEILERSWQSPPSNRRPEVTIAGVDCGRGQNWIWIAQFVPPLLYKEMTPIQAIESTVQNVVFAGDILVTEIPGKLKEYHVTYGLIDNEPDISESAKLADSTCLKMADQRNIFDDVQRGQVETGGIKYPCWFINNTKFLKSVLNSFILTDTEGLPLQRLPSTWQKWKNNNSELSPIRHLTGPSLDPDSGKWTRGDGHIDDLYYSCMFAQAAFYLWLTGKDGSQYVPGSGRSKQINTTPGKR